jgi:hypothetical protein
VKKLSVEEYGVGANLQGFCNFYRYLGDFKIVLKEWIKILCAFNILQFYKLL